MKTSSKPVWAFFAGMNLAISVINLIHADIEPLGAWIGGLVNLPLAVVMAVLWWRTA